MKYKYKTISNIYRDFYEQSEEYRISLIGKVLREKDRLCLYFPIQLALGEFNYGSQQGLIHFYPPTANKKGEVYCKVGASSPDDLDVDCGWKNPEKGLPDKVYKYLKDVYKINVTYKGIIFQIHKLYGGELYY